MAILGKVIRRIGCIAVVFSVLFFSVRGNFLLFTLSGWSKRALIARGSQGVFLEGYCYVLSLPQSAAGREIWPSQLMAYNGNLFMRHKFYGV